MSGIRCELCGSTEIIKEGELFVCQGCGAKYSKEAARKLIDQSAGETAAVSVQPEQAPAAPDAQNGADRELENWRTLARRARLEGNSPNAVDYYGRILEREPDDWEASFYQSYFRATDCKLAEIGSACQSVSVSLLTAHGLIEKSGKSDEEKFDAIKQIVGSTLGFADNITTVSENYISKNAGNEYAESSAYGWIQSCAMLYVTATTIISTEKWLKTQDGKNYAVSCYKRYNAYLADHGRVFKKDFRDKYLQQNTEFIQKYEPNYEKPEKSDGGCYVATCMYGSYDCPQVWTLRRYRDQTLAATAPGRAFIRAYYAISPRVVRAFGDKAFFQRFFRSRLDRMVAKLNQSGVEDTPYSDRPSGSF